MYIFLHGMVVQLVDGCLDIESSHINLCPIGMLVEPNFSFIMMSDLVGEVMYFGSILNGECEDNLR